jgi:putative spermidine/putrescine transport system ATP-binding protein
MSQALVSLVNVNKTYGRIVALHNLSLEIAEGQFVTLLGPSGSGKTTTLMLIAGFEQPTRGEILIRGESLVGRPPERRDIGMVFQSYALFPHMTVFENVAFPLRARKFPVRDVTRSVGEALEAVRLPGLGERYPRQLSGGQQQRVALARALVYRPSLLLMDEPLGALDRKLREEMQSELKGIQRELGVTTLYVTHDQQEALALSDQIAVMNAGDVVQVGPPLELYEHPADDFVASFLGDVNFLEGTVVRWLDGLALIDVHPGFVVPVAAGAPLTPGKRVRLAIRPERLLVGDGGPAEAPTWSVVVRDVVFHGEMVRYVVETPRAPAPQGDTAVPGPGSNPRAGRGHRAPLEPSGLAGVRMTARRQWLLLVGPALTLLLVCYLYPLAKLLVMSVGSAEPGLAAYQRFFGSPVYLTVFFRTLRISLVVTAVCLSALRHRQRGGSSRGGPQAGGKPARHGRHAGVEVNAGAVSGRRRFFGGPWRLGRPRLRPAGAIPRAGRLSRHACHRLMGLHVWAFMVTRPPPGRGDGTLGSLISRAVSHPEAFAAPVHAPDFKSGVRL